MPTACHVSTGAAQPAPLRRLTSISARLRTLTACLVCLAIACSGSPSSRKSASAKKAGAPGSVVRYRLLLRENPVDSGEAFRCYGRCQGEADPKGYLKCLSGCPGFEVKQGVACEKYETPPEAACLTARKLPATSEVPPGYVVLAIIGSFMFIVGASSLCALSGSQCTMGGVPRYPPPR